MRKIKEVLRLLQDGMSNREIARRVRIGAGSVSRYLKRAKAAGLVCPINEDWTEDKIYSVLFPATSKNSSLPHPDFGKVHKELKRKGGTLFFFSTIATTLATGLSDPD